jgi:hypothetical protein
MTKLYVRERGLTLTSFRPNMPGSPPSEWIDRIFGSRAVHNRDLLSRNRDNVSNEAFTSFRENFQLPPNAINPPCSVEILGSVRLNQEKPFIAMNRQQLIVGNASMTLGLATEPWPCYYRPSFERWRHAKFYWSVFIYCPALSETACQSLSTTKRSIRGVVNMDLETTIWQSKFIANNFKPNQQLKYILPSIPEKNSMAVCLSIPYTTSDPRKVIVNGALIFEWVQYYSLLGFKVMIYDKNGVNRKYITNSDYGKAQGKKGSQWLANVVYHPNTILGLLDKQRLAVTYDNTEHELRIAQGKSFKKKKNVVFGSVASEKYTDDDKTATLTHCRFEASAMYGIDNVIVADFDEFVYCPNAAPTFAGQRNWIDNLMTKYKADNIDQLIFLQVWTAAKLKAGNYSTPMSCMHDKVVRSQSIFECFAGFDYPVRNFHTGKSLHLGHKCPLTDFHSSCSSSDCSCSTSYPGYHRLHSLTPPSDRCFFMHLSSNPSDYLRRKFSNRTRDLYEATPSELSEMTQRYPLK